ncbi:MAG: RNA 2',3'-cyclic phosphodiesterase [Nitrososphaerota archaeon]|jgi:2'-5' RNA ligase|nr:RNA 2',3'-cyclic phosphodiesterase [Nitrososphaerota archaeon]MDG6946478.1 RNA 2',3'-cyclic phosphodiesterase [Nitrososphaerota archaeon]MDG6947770.1 RNA 2',3'-cyclic phosphodiesterase [Nitrososphaerota archaeon]
MRLFVALDLPGPVLDALVRFQRELTATGADIKQVERENLHFTVKFLGEVTEAAAAEAKSRLAALPSHGAEVELKGVGAFPDRLRPRVVWAGVSRADSLLIEPIAKEVSAALAGIGESDTRRFQAHVTLARVRSPKNTRGLSARIGEASEASFGPVKLTELKLKSSRLTPAGPVYTDIGVYRLR